MEKVIFQHLPIGAFGTNCYVFGDAVSREVVVIDPADKPDIIESWLDEKKVRLKAIINTHGHFDHVGANARLHKMTGAPIWIHRFDAYMLTKPDVGWKLEGPNALEAHDFLFDGQEIALGGLKVKVLHTPGHSPGGICLYCGDHLFSGDTLFRLSIGRCDLPGGDFDTLISSIREKLLGLPDHVQVFPGHGPFSTIGEEKLQNPYFRTS
ncbi:MAG: MBL fold metallo-hydrolase [Clostridiales bacterium]|nr:MBL fold metallo-hydrolase [Clostridiales bacterium]